MKTANDDPTSVTRANRLPKPAPFEPDLPMTRMPGWLRYIKGNVRDARDRATTTLTGLPLSDEQQFW